MKGDVGVHVAEDGFDLIHHRRIRTFAPCDQIHLVDGEHDVPDAEQRGDAEVAPCLLDHAMAGVDEHQGDIGDGRSGHHVPGVLRMPGSVGQNKAPLGRREVAVGDIDGDALLAFGSQAVGQQRQVHLLIAVAAAGLLDRIELVLEDRLGVVQQATDERGLAVVDRTGGSDPKLTGSGAGGGHQK